MTLDRDRVAAALGAYEVEGELGRGGWGVVLAGRHRQLGREVAIKELPRAFAGDPAVRARFVSEARLLASLDHPHIVPVYDYVEHDGLCLLVMEKLPGGTVWEEFTAQGIVAERACAVVLATCTALQFAHQRGILHRDIKPENLMYSAEGVVKVTDFGIAKVIGGSETMATRAGDILGTPAYMAPEQAQGRELGPATDIYAVGTMLYELLTGRLPYPEDGDPLTTLYRHVHEEPVQLGDVMPSVPEPIAAVAMRAIARDPAARPPTAEQLGLDLAEAATAVWGPGWLGARGGVAVMAAGPIVAVTERPTGGAPPAPVEAAPARPTVPPVPVAAGVAGPAPPTIVPGAPVRPTASVHAVGAAVRVAAADVVPVKAIVPTGASPVVPFLVGAVLSALVVLAAFAGLGRPSHDKAAGGTTINGADPSASTLAIDFAEPLTVAMPGSAEPPGSLRASVKVAGFTITTATEPLRPVGDTDQATFDLGAARYAVAGSATLELARTGTGRRQAFEVTSKQSPWLTGPAIGAIALALFCLAYVEALGKPLRKGRRRMASIVGVAVLAGGLAVALDVVLWAAGAPEPAPAGLATGAALGAAAGVAYAIGQLRAGQRRRLRRVR